MTATLTPPPSVGQWRYHHQQMVPATVWTVPHNLGGKPNVTVVDSGGNQVEGDVHYVDDISLTLTFATVFGGDAYLS